MTIGTKYSEVHSQGKLLDFVTDMTPSETPFRFQSLPKLMGASLHDGATWTKMCQCCFGRGHYRPASCANTSRLLLQL